MLPSKNSFVNPHTLTANQYTIRSGNNSYANPANKTAWYLESVWVKMSYVFIA